MKWGDFHHIHTVHKNEARQTGSSGRRGSLFYSYIQNSTVYGTQLYASFANVPYSNIKANDNILPHYYYTLLHIVLLPAPISVSYPCLYPRFMNIENQ